VSVDDGAGSATVWFADDDPGYVEWLADHPEGFVLDTHAPPRPGHLILHRAACPRVSRPLPGVLDAPRFGKACAATAAELRAWATGLTDGAPRSCSLCGGDGT
jgi:hypothetical protein